MEKRTKAAIVAGSVFVAVVGGLSLGAIVVNALLAADLLTKLSLSGGGMGAGSAAAYIFGKRGD